MAQITQKTAYITSPCRVGCNLCQLLETDSILNIALVGFSAGGHLALLYAYQAKQGYYDYGDNIQLVISEAGPTYLSEEEIGALPDKGKDPIYLMAGTNNTSEDRYEKILKASPITYANTDSPYTIYARGSNDGTTKKDQPIALVKKLLPDYENDEDGAIEEVLNSNALIDESNCAFFSFAGYVHNSFGEDKDVNGDKIIDPGIHPLNPECNAYYNAVETKVKNL